MIAGALRRPPRAASTTMKHTIRGIGIKMKKSPALGWRPELGWQKPAPWEKTRKSTSHAEDKSPYADRDFQFSPECDDNSYFRGKHLGKGVSLSRIRAPG